MNNKLKIKNSRLKIQNPDKESSIFNLQSSMDESGMALIIIVAIVAILSAIGITFMYNMRLEEKTAFNYVNSLKASYIAKSGIEHAIAALKSDGGDTGFDAYSERWGYDTDINNSDDIFNAETDDDAYSVDNDTNIYSNSHVTQTPGCLQGRDSRWFYVYDENNNIIGRYAVLILDESSKLNINTAGYGNGWDNFPSDPRQGWKPFEISLENFLKAGEIGLGWSWVAGDAHDLARELIDDNIYNAARYGLDLLPGEALIDDNADSIILATDGIDNDADGIVDNWYDVNGTWNLGSDLNGDGQPTWGEPGVEIAYDEPIEGVDDPYEFVGWNQYYDDAPFIVDKEIGSVVIFEDVQPYITVYSSDENTTDSGFLRMNINLVKDAMALYTVMYEAWEDLYLPGGYDELRRLAAQVAVNTIDYADRDNVSTLLEITDAAGSETTIARGVEAIRFNEIMVKPAYQWEAEELFASQLLGAPNWDTNYGDTFICSIEPDDTITDAYIQLKREGYYRVKVLSYDDCTESAEGYSESVEVGPPGTLTDSDQSWTDIDWTDATIEILSGAAKGQIYWIQSNTSNQVTIDGSWTDVPDMVCHYIIEKDNSFVFRIYKGDDIILEDTAGAHNIGGWLLEDFGVPRDENDPDKDILLLPAGNYKIELKTSPKLNKATGARLGYIQFSQEPDCEYVELVNISDKDINISEWTLTTSGGYVGTIPKNTIIKAEEAENYMVLVVDRDDNMEFMLDPRNEMSGKRTDNIAFKNTWPGIDRDKYVRALELSAEPINIAENTFGDTIVLRGSVFEDSPFIRPAEWETYGNASPANSVISNYTLTDDSKTWVDDQWKGATITAMIQFDFSDSQITRQIVSNTSDEITISGKWLWDDVPISATNYYIFFPSMAVTLWEGPLADRRIVAQVDYRVEDVNKVCYIQNSGTIGVPVYGFVALEKNDPTAITDFDEDGVDDTWLINIAEEGLPIDMRGGTPGTKNSVVPDDKEPGRDIKVRNLPFATIGDIKDVSTSDTEIAGGISAEWSKLGYAPNGAALIDEIMALADKITVSQKRLEAENFTNYSNNWTLEQADTDTFLTPFYSTNGQNVMGFWEWGIDQRINPDTGIYTLYISGKVLRDDIDKPDTMLVKVITAPTASVGGYDERALSFSPDNIACYGQITIGEAIPAGFAGAGEFLRVEIRKDIPDNKICFDAVILTPEYKGYGLININTADTPVLQALPGIDDTIAQAIVAYRRDMDGADNEYGFVGVDDDNSGMPTGNPGEYNWPGSDDGPFNDIGEILNVLNDPALGISDSMEIFSKISNLITTKSKTFTIISTGQALRESDRGDFTYNSIDYEILAEKKYIVVFER